MTDETLFSWGEASPKEDLKIPWALDEKVLDPQERDLREKGRSYLINCYIYGRGYTLLGVTSTGGLFGVGLKGYIICPLEQLEEVFRKHLSPWEILKAFFHSFFEDNPRTLLRYVQEKFYNLHG